MEFEQIRHRDENNIYKVKGDFKHYIYTPEEAAAEEIVPIANWREAIAGDYVLTDGDPEPRVIQILYSKKVKRGTTLRTARGTFNTNGKMIDSQKRENRYTFSRVNPILSTGKPDRKILESHRGFAKAIVPTITEEKPQGDYKEAYRTLHPDASDGVVSNNAHRNANSPVIQRAIKEELELHGLTPKLAIDTIVKTMKKTPSGRPKYSDQLKAAEMDLKMHGFLEKKEESGKPTFLSLTEEEWDEKEQIHRKRTATYTE